MVNTPAVTPVTIPVVEPTVATAVELLDHVTPVVVSPKEIVEPAHTLSGPGGVIAPNIGNLNSLPGVVADKPEVVQVIIQR